MCGQWSGQGRESRAWGTLRAPAAAAKGENTTHLHPPHTHCRLHTLTRLVQEHGMGFHFYSGDIYLVRGAQVRPLPRVPPVMKLDSQVL